MAGNEVDDRIYQYGDVYSTLEVCDTLDSRLAVLRRQGLLSEGNWRRCRRELAAVRRSVEESILGMRSRPWWRRLIGR